MKATQIRNLSRGSQKLRGKENSNYNYNFHSFLKYSSGKAKKQGKKFIEQIEIPTTSSETVPLESGNALRTDAPTNNESGLLKLPDLPNFNLNFPNLELPTIVPAVPASTEENTSRLHNGVEGPFNS